MLEGFGVNAEAEAVYRAMLAAPDGCITEIAARLHLCEQEVRKRLDELVDLSLLRPSWDVPGTVRAVSPDVGLTALLARQQAGIARQEQLVAQSRLDMAAFVSQFPARRGETSDAEIEELWGLDGVRLKLEQLERDARTEVLAFQPGPHTEEGRRASRPLDESSLGRGLRMRDVFMDSMRNDRPMLHHVQWLSARGAQIRTAPTLPLRMILYDRKVAVIPMDPEHSRRGALLTRSRGTVTALLALFEQVWQRATPLGAPTQLCAGSLTPQEQELLRMLTAGTKDACAARQLGVSVRTVRRMVAELASRLGASSRFQAGVNAARQGWL